jgi:hypothetical protein
MSECILELREILGAPIRPHWFFTLLWALVVHAGEAPGRSYDLAAFDPVSLQSIANRRSSADMRSIAAFVGSHVVRGLGRETWHKQQRSHKVCDLHRFASLIEPRASRGMSVSVSKTDIGGWIFPDHANVWQRCHLSR